MAGVNQGTGSSFSGAPRFCGWAATFRAAPSCTGRPAQIAAGFSALVCARHSSMPASLALHLAHWWPICVGMVNPASVHSFFALTKLSSRVQVEVLESNNEVQWLQETPFRRYRAPVTSRLCTRTPS